MTSDAKIGLLLGLVFIFVIAFVINGLPSLRPPIGKVEATTLTGEDFEIGVTGRADKAFNLPDSVEQPRVGSNTAQAAAQETKPVAQETPRVVPQTTGDEGVRSQYSLGGIADLIRGLTPIQKDRPDTISLGTPKPVAEPPDAGSHPPVAAVPQTKPEPKSEPRTESKPVNATNPTKVADLIELPKPATAPSQPATIPGGKLYVVVAGDNLPAIAKKFYGPEEGNRLVNVNAIFQANQTILKSPSEVIVGQKLIIPPLPKPAAPPAITSATAPKPTPAAVRPEDVLPKALFEQKTTIDDKIQALRKRPAATMPAPTPEGRWYIVQNGDSLWKIATGQLGSGARCEEIAKLNADILTSPDTLAVGMRLRLPAK